MNNLLMFPSRAKEPVRVLEMRACARSEAENGMDGIYRQYTLLLLRRYFRLSVDMGRLPSVLGREFFRAKVTSYKMHTFEEAVIFVHDMERCVERLGAEEKRLLSALVFMQYSQSEMARLLGVSRGAIARRYNGMLDRLTEVLLEIGMIDRGSLRRARGRMAKVTPIYPAPPKKACGAVSCQEAGSRPGEAALTKEGS